MTMQDTKAPIVPDYDTTDADREFERWFDHRFHGDSAQSGRSGEPYDSDTNRVEMPVENYDAGSDDAPGEADDFEEDWEDYSDQPGWFERNKWRVLGGTAAVFAVVLIFSLLGGFGGDDDSQADGRGDVQAPEELSADEIVNRPSENTDVPERPVLVDRNAERSSESSRASVTPRDIQRGGSPYSSMPDNDATDNADTAGATDTTGTANGGARPAPAPETEPAPEQQPAPAPAPANKPDSQATPSAEKPSAEKPSVETVYQTPDR